MYRNSFITATILYLVIFTILMPLQASEINKTFSKKESIQIKAVLGSCNVIKSNDDMIHVTLKYSFKEEEFHAKFSENSNVLSLEEEFIVKKPNGSSLWTIAIPDNIKIIFNSSTGNFNVEGVESEFTCNTGTGSITIQDGE